MATSSMNDNWNYVKSQIEAIWTEAEFDDAEMKKARGNLRKMVSLIVEKSVESAMVIRQKMSAIF